MTHADKEAKALLVNRAVLDLIEHFDAVQILVSFTEGGHTCGIKKGAGDFYSRLGLAREFLIEDNERSRCFVRHENDSDDDDGPETWAWL